MKSKRVTSTTLKRKTGEILDEVRINKEEIIITKGNKDVAVIRPIIKKKSLAEMKKILNKYYGISPNFPDVVKDRRSGNRKILPFN